MVKKGLAAVIPFLIAHLICCGGLLVVLISSGYLLRFYNEGQNKTLLLPALGLLGLGWWLTSRHKAKCHEEGRDDVADRIIRGLLYLMIYAVFSWIIIVYVFIPWWIPGYQGGPLLP